jgi:histidine triad (HIT) family protein
MKRLLYSIAKTWLGGFLLHWIFAFLSFVIPEEKLIETDSLLAFSHPSPAYPLHILIVPKKKIQSLLDLPTQDQSFEKELFQTVKDLVQIFSLESYGYRLILNGGKNQKVNHLHFHLISEDYEIDFKNTDS